jgi:hypothetical protein
MEMHECGQIKTVPIRRICHATHETIHPLTHADSDVQGEGLVVCFLILRSPTHGAYQEKIKITESYWTRLLCT